MISFLFTEVVHVWYICKLEENYEIYVYLQTQKSNLQFSPDDIKDMITHTIDELGLPTRRSIIVQDPTVHSMDIQLSDFSLRGDYIPVHFESADFSTMDPVNELLDGVWNDKGSNYVDFPTKNVRYRRKFFSILGL